MSKPLQNQSYITTTFYANYTIASHSQFGPLHTIRGYNLHYFGPVYSLGLFRDSFSYDQHKHQIICDDYPPRDVEDDQEMNKNNFFKAAIELWQTFPEINNVVETEKDQADQNLTIPGLLGETPFINAIVAKE